jgi:predicted permease
VFTIALPVMLFHLMSRMTTLPPVDIRLLIAFFGGCLLVFAAGRWIAAAVFRLDGVSQSVFALGGVFSNNVFLGLPIARLTLGPQVLPSVALVVVFNAFTLWTLVTISVEWARHGSLSLSGFGRTAISVLQNPLVMAIVAGCAFAWSELHMPQVIDAGLNVVSDLAAPGSLLVLGMGLKQYGIRRNLRQSLAICALKLLAQPLVVWLLAWMLDLPATETSAVVLLASMSVGANVYLMSQQFDTLQGAVASSLVLSTALAAITTPLFLTMLSALR